MDPPAIPKPRLLRDDFDFDDDDHGDGPYFDLEFSLDNDRRRMSSSSSSSDGLFFIKRVDSSSKPLATKFGYFLLRFKSRIKSLSRHQKVGPEAEAETEELRSGGVEVIHKYLSKIKPLYVRVSKKYGDRLRFSGQLAAPGGGDREPPPPASSGAKFGRQFSAGNSPMAEIRRRMRKCRSASSAAVAAVPSPPPPPRRRDDSLAQHEDGIEGAIAHCKRSFHSDIGSDLGLVRSRSDPGGGRSGGAK